MTGLLATYGEAGQTYGGTGGYGGSPATFPTFMVEVETTPGVWEPVECDVRSLEINRGRSEQLDSSTAGTLTVALADESDRYNAWNPVGVWSRNSLFRTDLGIRVSVVLDYTVERMFTGTTDDVRDSWPGAGADALTEVHATDAFKGLARSRPAKVAAVGAGELPGARINRVLDAVSYTGPRNVEAGTIAMAATTLDNTALNLCDETRESEWGAFYIDRTGTVRFRARDSLVTDPRQASVQWVFVDRHGDNLLPNVSHPTILEDPFNTLTNWTGGTPTLVPGRNGTALQQSGSNAPVFTTTTDYGSQWTIGFAYRNVSLQAVRLVAQVRNDIADNAISLQASTNGSLTLRTGGIGGPVLGSSAPGFLAENVWAFIEISLTCAEAPAGAVTVRVNGANAIGPLTGVDTHGAGSTSLRSLAFNGGGAGGVAQYDDCYITTGPFLGDVVLPLPPSTDVPTGCYSDLKLVASDDAVYNVATITRPGGSPQQASIADSLAWYGPRTYTRDNLPINDDLGALTLAQTITANHAYNERKVQAVVLEPAWYSELWPAAIGVRMLDRVRVIRHTGVVIDAELQVQAIHHTIIAGGDGRASSWTTTLETTNARLVRDAGQWDLGRWDEAKWSV